MTNKICLMSLISQEPYIIWLSFMVHLCKMMIYLGFFFHFFRILILCVVRRVKGQKMAQNDKKKLSHAISHELYLIWLWFLAQMCKMVQHFFFHFYQNSDFSCFLKFINKCQKEILRCAPPSSHLCDFFLKWLNIELILENFGKVFAGGQVRNFLSFSMLICCKCLEHCCFSSRPFLKQLASHISAHTLQLKFLGMTFFLIHPGDWSILFWKVLKFFA